MFGLGTLIAAFRNLANSLNALADTVNQTNAGLRSRLLLDGPTEEEQADLPALPDNTTPASNGQTTASGKRKSKAAAVAE